MRTTTTLTAGMALALGLLAPTLLAQATVTEATSERAESFENGLLPPTVEKGEKGKPVTLLERMFGRDEDGKVTDLQFDIFGQSGVAHRDE